MSEETHTDDGEWEFEILLYFCLGIGKKSQLEIFYSFVIDLWLKFIE